MEEVKLLRKIADEAKVIWDKGNLPLEAAHLKNLLTDRIDYNNRNEKQVANEVAQEYKGVTPIKVLGIVDACFHMYASNYRADAQKMAKKLLV